MDLNFTDEQQMLKDMTREFLEAECPKALVRSMEHDDFGYPEELWSKMAELGWMGLVFPEEYGGAEFAFEDMAILLEEMGRAILPGPFFSTVVLCGQAILDSGTKEQKAEFLGKIANGELIMALALTEPEGYYEARDITTRADWSGNDYVINGSKFFVADAQVANCLLVVARTSESEDPLQGLSLFIVDSNTPGITVSPLGVLGIDKQGQIEFDNVIVPSDRLLGIYGNGWDIVEKLMVWGAIGKCAESVGGAEAAMELAVSYVNGRNAFGQTIGSLQAIQHHCANMLVDVETSRLLTYQAASLVSQGKFQAQQISMAKAWVSDAYGRVTSLVHQCHGGIAFTKEMDIHLYHKKAKVNQQLFGDAYFHQQRITDSLKS
mgnify:FL=1